MTDSARSPKGANFAQQYDKLARAWARHEDLRRSGAPILELFHSSLELSQARSTMNEWWTNQRMQGMR